MSHTVKIQVQFKQSELPQLKKAFKQLGWGFIDNSKIREYLGESTEVYPHVALNPSRLNGAYDVGFKIEAKGILTPYTDYYGGSVEQTLGKDLCKLKQEFAAAIVEDEYGAATITRTMDAHGNLLLEVGQY